MALNGQPSCAHVRLEYVRFPIDYSQGSNRRRGRSRRLGNTTRLAFASISPTRARARLKAWLSAAIRSVPPSAARSPWSRGKATKGHGKRATLGDGLPACAIKWAQAHDEPRPRNVTSKCVEGCKWTAVTLCSGPFLDVES